MLEIEKSRKRTLIFNVNISGQSHNTVEGSFKIKDKNGIEYGIPIKVEEGRIVVDIPPLSNIISGLSEGVNDIVSVKLEAYGGGYYVCPWEDEARLKEGFDMQVSLFSEDQNEEINQSSGIQMDAKLENEDNKLDQINEVDQTVKPRNKVKSKTKNKSNLSQVKTILESKGIKGTKITNMILEKVKDEVKSRGITDRKEILEIVESHADRLTKPYDPMEQFKSFIKKED